VPASVKVPSEVMGPPLNERPVAPPEISTEVREPEPPPLFSGSRLSRYRPKRKR
jgi:hypothetical protein